MDPGRRPTRIPGVKVSLYARWGIPGCGWWSWSKTEKFTVALARMDART